MSTSAETSSKRKESANADFPRVSIITVVFNAEEHIESTLHAVGALQYPNLQYIVIDGDSTDATVHIIKAHREYISIFISEKDRGIYDAMNKGLRVADGEYVWFLNAGDAPADEHILCKIFSKSSDSDYYYGATRLIDANGRLVNVLTAPSELTRRAMHYGMQISHQSFIVRRSIASQYDLNYRFIADQKWIVQILSKTTNGMNVGMPLSNYLLGGLSESQFGKFVLEKIRYSFDELPWWYALSVAVIDVLKAFRFYCAAALRRSGIV